MHKVEISTAEAQVIAEELCKSLDRTHGGAWYIDFKNDTHHYIIFPDRIFFIDRTSKEQYDGAKNYGLALGIPEYQIDFHPHVLEWKR